MKRFFTFCFLVCLVSLGYSQELLVKSFKLSEGDLSARTPPSAIRLDNNDKICALVKVGLALDGVEFECSGGVKDVVKKTGEYWVYMPKGNSMLRILHQDYVPLMINFYDYGVGKLKSGATYILSLSRSIDNDDKNKTLIVPVKNGFNIELVKVESGSFVMGATSEIQNPYSWEKPAHKVILTKDYYIGKYEVTQSLWQLVMEKNPSSIKGEDLPVGNVSWNDCQLFIAKLNEMTGKKFRLPTEAEWEYAARGGNKSRGTQYSGSSLYSDVAWYEGNSNNRPHPVGTKKSNELGIYDMNGNVWELCQDWWGNYIESSQKDPDGPNSGPTRIARGGSYIAGAITVAARAGYSPNIRDMNLGFRLALSK